MDGALMGTTTSSQSGSLINSNERVVYTPQSSKTGVSPLDAVGHRVRVTPEAPQKGVSEKSWAIFDHHPPVCERVLVLNLTLC